MKQKCFIIGNVTIDHNNIDGKEIIGPGGPPIFYAAMLKNLGLSVIEWLPRGDDFPVETFEGVTVLPETPTGKATLIYRNIYNHDGSRVQYAILGDSWQMPPITTLDESIRREQDIVLVASVLNNLSAEFLSSVGPAFPNSLTALMPSGSLRKIREDGFVEICEWEEVEKVVGYFDLVILSEKDGNDLHKNAVKWSNLGPIVILTQEEKGCMIYHQGISLHVPAFKIDKIVDPTGAGDIFAAAFSFAYHRKPDLVTVAQFANAAAGMSLRYLPNEIKYQYRDIIAFAGGQGTVINFK